MKTVIRLGLMLGLCAYVFWQATLIRDLDAELVERQSIMIAMANRNQQLEGVMAEVIPAFEETYAALLQCRQAAGSGNRAMYSL